MAKEFKLVPHLSVDNETFESKKMPVKIAHIFREYYFKVCKSLNCLLNDNIGD